MHVSIAKEIAFLSLQVRILCLGIYFILGPLSGFVLNLGLAEAPVAVEDSRAPALPNCL